MSLRRNGEIRTTDLSTNMEMGSVLGLQEQRLTKVSYAMIEHAHLLDDSRFADNPLITPTEELIERWGAALAMLWRDAMRPQRGQPLCTAESSYPNC